jgi:hypothetical protein
MCVQTALWDDTVHYVGIYLRACGLMVDFRRCKLLFCPPFTSIEPISDEKEIKHHDLRALSIGRSGVAEKCSIGESKGSGEDQNGHCLRKPVSDGVN